MKTVLFSFKTIDERDAFLSKIKDACGDFISEALESIRLDPAVKSAEERHAALWVSGTRIIEGPMPQIERMFKQECESHNAMVEIRELKNGDWQRIKIRTKT